MVGSGVLIDGRSMVTGLDRTGQDRPSKVPKGWLAAGWAGLWAGMEGRLAGRHLGRRMGGGGRAASRSLVLVLGNSS